MIRLTRLDGRQFILNSDLIDFFESTPDTVITLRNGNKMIVKEKVDVVLEKIINFKQTIYNNPVSREGNKLIVNTDTPDIFNIDNNLKNLKYNDIRDIEYDDEEEYDDDEYED